MGIGKTERSSGREQSNPEKQEPCRAAELFVLTSIKAHSNLATQDIVLESTGILGCGGDWKQGFLDVNGIGKTAWSSGREQCTPEKQEPCRAVELFVLTLIRSHSNLAIQIPF